VIGSPTRSLAERTAPDTLLVVGTRRSGSISQWGWTTGSRVVATSEGVVAVVPLAPATGRGIVVGVDGSPDSGHVLRFAAIEATRLHEPVHVVFAWRVPMSDPIGTSDPISWTRLRRSSDDIVARIIDDVAPDFPGLEISQSIEEGDAASILHERAQGSRMLIIGSHGYGLIRRLVVGSVGHDLMMGITCPTLVVHRDSVVVGGAPGGHEAARSGTDPTSSARSR
jgi:nucleotide-binding universal stress UspA family protein